MTDRPEPQERQPAQSGRSGPDHTHRTPSWALIGLVLCGALAVPTLARTWSALRASDTTQRQQTVGFVDYGIELGYTAIGQPSDVYPTGSVQATKNLAGALDAGGPLYRRLLDRIEVDLAFDLSSDGAERLDAAYSVDVELRTPDGWSAPLDGVPLRPLSGAAREQVTIDIRSAASQVAQIAELTGVGGATYSVVVAPTLEVTAGIDDSDGAYQLTSPLELLVDGDVITATGTDRSESTPLQRRVVEDAQFDIGPFTTSTQTARAVLSGLALALIGGVVWFASVLFGGFGLREPARIATRYRSQIVDVSVASAPPGPVVMVGSIEELARIAKVDQNVILHEDLGDGAHRYRVFLGTVTYEYETAPAHPGGVLAADVPGGESS